MEGFHCRAQREMLAPYADKFFEVVVRVFQEAKSAFGARDFFDALCPPVGDDDKVIKQLEELVTRVPESEKVRAPCGAVRGVVTVAGGCRQSGHVALTLHVWWCRACNAALPRPWTSTSACTSAARRPLLLARSRHTARLSRPSSGDGFRLRTLLADRTCSAATMGCARTHRAWGGCVTDETQLLYHTVRSEHMSVSMPVPACSPARVSGSTTASPPPPRLLPLPLHQTAQPRWAHSPHRRLCSKNA